MLYCPREFSHQTADSQGYSGTTRHHTFTTRFYLFTETFTECDMKSFKQLFDTKAEVQ
jgi:hypothetical protein